jgi:UDP-N-acetylmuramoyl-tripeptide--D-alanyl-D-alanine ligase
LGETAAKVTLDYLYLLGNQAAQVRKGALRGGMKKERIVVGKDHADLARQLHGRVKQGDWLLFKGSRGMKMEKIIEQFRHGKA